MNPVDVRAKTEFFPQGSRAVLVGANQKEYITLPCVITPDGLVVSRWEPTPEEREAVAKGEDIFLTLMMGKGVSVTPSFVSVGPVNWNQFCG